MDTIACLATGAKAVKRWEDRGVAADWLTVGKALFMGLILALGTVDGRAQTASSDDSRDGTAVATRTSEGWQNLETLVQTIDSTRTQLAERRAALRASENERERTRLSGEVEQLSLDLESLQTAWEMLATGGADLQVFGVKTEAAFNWRDELQSVFEPILVELKRLTDRPRKIERLRSELAYLQQRLGVAETALASIVSYREQAPSPELKQAFEALEDRWQRRRDDLKNRRDLTNYELQSLLSPPKEAERNPIESLKSLLSGRILNLVIALLAMTLVYAALRLLARAYGRFLSRRGARRRAFVARVGTLVFYLLTAVLVLLSGMAVFYVRGDWLLLGLVLIVLAGAAWALQRSLPRFLTEARLILNLGPVREGERVIYNGLPWRVNALNFYATLHNPLLQGGTLQLPVRELVGYVSRRYEDEEPWFPTRRGDFVILDDASFGEVLAQTPEFVQVRVLGAVKTYTSTAFLDQRPRNLSLRGFTLVMTFGLDYQHQRDITTAICDDMRQALHTGLQRTDLGAHLGDLSVEFSEAGASSLDLAAIVTFDGAAAAGYFRIKRMMQRLAVEACNTRGWTIPFSQMTVHMAPG